MRVHVLLVMRGSGWMAHKNDSMINSRCDWGEHCKSLIRKILTTLSAAAETSRTFLYKERITHERCPINFISLAI